MKRYQRVNKRSKHLCLNLGTLKPLRKKQEATFVVQTVSLSLDRSRTRQFLTLECLKIDLVDSLGRGIDRLEGQKRGLNFFQKALAFDIVGQASHQFSWSF